MGHVWHHAVVLATCGVLATSCSPAAAPAQPTKTVTNPSSSASSLQGSKPPDDKRNDLHPDDALIAGAGQEYLDLFVEIHPEDATALGLHAHDADLDDRTIAGHDKNTDREEALLKSFEERFKAPKASASAD